MSQHAKTVVAAVAAVLLSGVQAWQVVAGHPFRLIYLLPVAIAVVNAVATKLIPNTTEQPVAKAIVAGLLAALNGAASLLGGAPADVTALNLVIAALGALTLWYVPELAGVPTVAVVDAVSLSAKAAAGQPVSRDEIETWLKQLEQLDPAVADAGPPVPPGPLPIEAQALAAVTTAPLPAVDPGTEMPA